MRPPSLLPWVLAALLGAATAYLALRRPAPAAAPHAALAVPTCPACPAPRANDLAALRRCLDRTAALESQIERAARPDAGVRPPLSARAAACLMDPDVEAAVDARVEAEVKARREARRARRDEAGRALAGAADHLMTQILGLSREERDWVAEYVCAAREQREAVLREMQQGEVPTATWERIRGDREVMLKDLESYLGKERYDRLRGLGGLGLLADALGCD